MTAGLTRSFRDDLGTRALLLVVTAVWGLNVTVVKALTGWFSPELLPVARMVIAALALLAVWAWGRGAWPRLDARQWGWVAACAATMVYLNQVCLVGGLQRSTATNGAILMATGPMVASVLSAVFFREALRPARLMALALGFAGVAMVVLSRPQAQLAQAGWGDLLLFGASASYAAGGLIVQRIAVVIPTLSALTLSVLIHVLGAAMLAVHLVIADGGQVPEVPELSVTVALLLVFTSVGSVAWGSLVWMRTIARVGAARVSHFLYWIPIFGVAFAAVILGEPLTVWHGLGLLAVIAGTWLSQRPTR